ncbi:MAG: lamin tail domain-containing protein [Phaeodactylibacter sp.]|nr:lamin tail domain-containing protein [Phaeodactylibacter sp.]MCB9052017.1 lamin tail domain-containing protein [Lewinellaceae bacterium]
MERITAFALMFLLCAHHLSGQLQDDFSDGDFTNDPEWFGDTGKFVVSGGQLQLLDSEPGPDNASYLYLPAPTSTDAATTWEALVRMEFAPSASNFTRIYLSASSPNLTEAQEGYYLRIGGISGSDDAIELYRQDGNTSTLLISGTPGAVGTAPAIARIRASRSPDGQWELQADYTGGMALQGQGSALDDTYPMGSFFGVYCQYTSTRNEAFFFDDISIGPLFQDTRPPLLLEVEATGALEAIARFDEPLDETSAAEPGNYQLDNGIGQPAEVIFNGATPTEVRLLLGTPLENTQSYMLTASNIADASGNIAAAQSRPFTYYNLQPAAFGDIVFSELLPDPTPSAGLPEGEFVELFNRSDKVIQLSGLALSSGSPPAALPEFLLLPGGYVTICDDSFEGDFAVLGPTVAVNSFPALTNSGDEVRLSDANGNLIAEVIYEDSWYQDESRAGGGYSLELIQTEGPYDCPGNWQASVAATGGTPGLPNSLLGAETDNTPPALAGAFADSEFELRIVFSEVMAISPLDLPDSYAISPPVTISEALAQPNRKEVILLLETPLEPGTSYQASFPGAITDCMGNALPAGTSITTGLAEPLEPRDIIINEALFNPEAGGSDFIEVYNRSGKVLNLNGIVIANTQKESGDTLGAVSTDYLLFPGEYAVLSESPDDIANRYTVRFEQALVEANLPTLEDKSGNITLRYSGQVIDAFDYSEALHYPLLDSKEGVSLERISPEAPTQDGGNWHSAASTAGFATPTYQNSQFFEKPTFLEEMFSVLTPTFSPDGDGFDDVLLIDYETERPGYTLNLHVYDSHGRLTRRLANNETLASGGRLKWDGLNEEGARARIGIYILWFEVFTPDGKVERDKKVAVLASRLD